MFSVASLRVQYLDLFCSLFRPRPYINDLIVSEDAKIYLFADDARLYNRIKCIIDGEILQSKNDKFTNWAYRWLLVKLSRPYKEM